MSDKHNPAYKGTPVERFGWALRTFRDAAASGFGRVVEKTIDGERFLSLEADQVSAERAVAIVPAWLRIALEVDSHLSVCPYFNYGHAPVCSLLLVVTAPVDELRAAGFNIPGDVRSLPASSPTAELGN